VLNQNRDKRPASAKSGAVTDPTSPAPPPYRPTPAPGSRPSSAASVEGTPRAPPSSARVPMETSGLKRPAPNNERTSGSGSGSGSFFDYDDGSDDVLEISATSKGHGHGPHKELWGP
jgi:hypothetical protein